jgi:hypothetical protein
MRKLMAFLIILASAPATAAVQMPDFNPDKTCHEAFGEKGTRPSGRLLRICLESEQKHYNLSRTAWEYLTEDSAQACDAQVKRAIGRAHVVRRFNYPGLVDPYAELWLCVDKRLKAEDAHRPPKPFQKW